MRTVKLELAQSKMWALANITIDSVTCFPFVTRYLWCPRQECPETTPFPCCKGLSRCGQKCGASSRGPSFISFIVTGCHVLGQNASVLYCGLRHIVLYHIRRHKHMFYLPFIRSLCVEWMCVFFRRRWEPTLIEDTIRFWPYRTNGACMETRTVRVRDLIATYNACK